MPLVRKLPNDLSAHHGHVGCANFYAIRTRHMIVGAIKVVGLLFLVVAVAAPPLHRR